MGIFFWKKNKEIDLFAKKLADEFYSEIQPEMILGYLEQPKGSKPGKLSKKVDRKLHETITAMQQFKNVNSLGVYGKARLHLSFIDRLNELGYEPDISKKLNENILIKTP